MNSKKGIAICHYNRVDKLEKLITSVIDTMPKDCKLVVCDDGSEPIDNYSVSSICNRIGVTLIQGPNRGVAANKNRALWALQDCAFLCILEDDLFPTTSDWFEHYEEASCLSGIHHFCRVQDKEVIETLPNFADFMKNHNLTPIYGPTPRGDLTFLTSKVLKEVGGFNPEFIGAGHAHGEWTERVITAGLVSHPLKYIDIKEARDKFQQIGDREGGRWNKTKEELDGEINRNKKLRKKLQKTGYIFHPLVLQ